MTKLIAAVRRINFRVISLTLFFTGFCAVAYTQPGQSQNIDSLELSTKIDSLDKLYGYKKTLSNNYKLSTLVALSYFPELDSLKIVFKETKINSSLNARPTVGSLLFRRRSKRKYVIRINNKIGDSTVLLSAASFNAKVGVFGHELNHIADYNQRGFFKILKRLFQYRKNETKEPFEKEIDQMTIDIGLGWQLHDWADHVLNHSNGKIEYLEYKRQIYLEPSEIIEIINRLEYNK